MNHLLQEMEGLLSISIKMSDRQNLDTIFFSKTRAKMLLSEIKKIKQNNLKATSKHIKKEPRWLSIPE
jgi:late competence protein required for DNA uptake (superfamily II DNA/RNA helicase)